MGTLILNLVESGAKIILEALLEKDASMGSIFNSSLDEDLKAIGNDLAELRIFLKEFKNNVVSKFGDSVFEFSNEPL